MVERRCPHILPLCRDRGPARACRRSASRAGSESFFGQEVGHFDSHVLNLMYRIKEDGTIVIVIIPAEESDWKDLKETTIACVRVDCILGGWIITPTPNEESCTVTWLMQANFGQCDPHGEFTIPAGYSSHRVKRAMLRDWAEEITHLNVALEQRYEPEYYRRLGPLVTNHELHKLELEMKATSPSSTTSSAFGSSRTPNSSPKKVVAPAPCTIEHPRVYHIAQELESGLCLMIHKNTNANVLIFKTNYSVGAVSLDSSVLHRY